MSGAAQFMLTGRFSPAMWQRIREDAGHPLAKIGQYGTRRAIEVAHFFYALDDHDFYAVVNAADPAQVWMLRNELMAGGGFDTLHVDPLYVFADLIGTPATEP